MVSSNKVTYYQCKGNAILSFLYSLRGIRVICIAFMKQLLMLRPTATVIYRTVIARDPRSAGGAA